MTNSKEELIQKIESAREVLNKSIDEKKQYDEVYQNSILLDTLIEQYIEAVSYTHLTLPTIVHV